MGKGMEMYVHPPVLVVGMYIRNSWLTAPGHPLTVLGSYCSVDDTRIIMDSAAKVLVDRLLFVRSCGVVWCG
jgi:hypothetical protein